MREYTSSQTIQSAAARWRALANSPPLSGNIALRRFMANGCSMMKPNGVWEPGHRQPTLLGFS